MPVSSLSTFQKAAQRKAFTQAALGALRPQFTAADAPALLALILHDAATYDPVTKTGGYDGSILLSRWVDRAVEICAMQGKQMETKGTLCPCQVLDLVVLQSSCTAG